jgi:hypothetical protein
VEPARRPDPGPIIRLLGWAQASATLVAALELRLFDHLAAGPAGAAELAERARISERGAQALLDAMVALDVVELRDGRYRNGPAADAYLVPGRPGYVGDEEAGVFHHMMPLLDRLAEIARSGTPPYPPESPEMFAFWTLLTPRIARSGAGVAERALRLLGLVDGAPHLIDVGGGAALYSLALLALNPRARATQVDWPHVNHVARERVRAAGHAARFETLDGNLLEIDLGRGRYDVAVLSNVMHQESSTSNTALLRRVHAALVPGGRLLVSEFVVDDGRAGPAHPLLFNLTMLTHTAEGKSYACGELARMFVDAGFEEPTFTPMPPSPSTIAVARAR